MRVCVLVCAVPPPEFGPAVPPLEETFREFLEPRLPEATVSHVMTVEGELPESVHDHDVYVITGSPSGAYEDDPWIAAAERFTREAVEAEKVVVGICFGHQLVAQALGGKVVKSEKGWGLGSYAVGVREARPWMPDPSEQATILVCHQDQVVDLPPQAEVLAGNDFCPNHMLQIGSKVLTFQGHPEMNAEMIDVILEARRDRIGEEVYSSGKVTKDQAVDQARVCDWLTGFIRHAHSL